MSTQKEIGTKVRELEKERREYQKSVMQEWESKYYYPKLKKLREQCEHNFRFTHLGPLGHAWSHCTVCGKSKVEE